MPARFWAMVRKDEPHRCWVWTGAKNAFGYGQTRYVTSSGKAEQKAHRVSWILANGEIPEGRLVLHECDNASCVNPAHLHLGSNKTNADEREARGRQYHPKGTRHYRAKLTERDIVTIRRAVACGAEPVAIAPNYGVTKRCIELIVRRVNWKHVA